MHAIVTSILKLAHKYGHDGRYMIFYTQLTCSAVEEGSEPMRDDQNRNQQISELYHTWRQVRVLFQCPANIERMFE